MDIELSVDYAIGINQSMQQTAVQANTVRHPDRLERIINQINKMINSNEDKIKILSYILRTFPIEQPFNNGNHRTAYAIFEKYCEYFGEEKLALAIRGKEAEEFVRYIEFLTEKQVEDKLRKYLL